MNKPLDYTVINREQLKLNIDKNEILRYLGYGSKDVDQATDNIINECINEILSVLKTNYIYSIYKIKKQSNNIFVEDVNLKLEGNDIFNHLKDCEKCAIMAVTLGSEVDRRIRYYSKADLTKSVVFDACATAAVEALCDKVEEEIKQLSLSKGCSITSRYSPGYGDLTIELQPTILKLLDTSKHIGLTVTDSCILIPRKSVTAIIGIGEDIEVRPIGCIGCSLINDCMYSKKGDSCGYSKPTK